MPSTAPHTPFDVCVVGLGICGAAAVYTLARYELRVLALEAENDAASWTTKANSAILHAGYDPPPGSLMAASNVRGAALAKEICAALDVPRHEIGSLVLAFDEPELAQLRALHRRGLENGVPGLALLGREAALAREPGLNPRILGALHAPSAAVVDPWEYALAMIESAVLNGCRCEREARVTALDFDADAGLYRIRCADGRAFRSRVVVNAAGLYADRVHELAGGGGFRIDASRGQYYLLDKAAGGSVSQVIFQCPGPLGKGVLVAPTVHGNLIVGPDAEPGLPRDAVDTTAEGLAFVRARAALSLPGIPWGESIRQFAGLRANTEAEDFIFGLSESAPHFINMAGIKSPGLTSAPALAEKLPALLSDLGLCLKEKQDFLNERRRTRFRFLSAAEKALLCREDPRYGRIVCRCEGVTEGEIREILASPFPPLSVEAVKRRCNAGMGRCQGGFCAARVRRLIAEVRGLSPEAVPLDRAGSFDLLGELKPGANSAVRPGRERTGRSAPAPAAAPRKGAAPPAAEPPAVRAGRGAPPARDWDLIVVGAGPAGLSAAFAAWQAEPEARILILEREAEPGGILNQCIHSGFGLHYFKEELTGPEYAERCLERLAGTSVRLLCDCMVLGLDGAMSTLEETGRAALRTRLDEGPLPPGTHLVSAISPRCGYLELRCRALVLAMGCRERPRGALGIPGTRPAGIMTAGAAQRYMNMENLLPGRRALILGSGDIGLIMARRLSLEGAEVLACVERLPYVSGLVRNRVQCLDDFGIPLLLAHTVTRTWGYPRLSAVEVSAVDADFSPIPGSGRRFDCDLLLLSAGLIPENELSRTLGLSLDARTQGVSVDQDLQSEVPGVFACGNALHVHDLVDFVSAESERAGRAAAAYARGTESGKGHSPGPSLRLNSGPGISYVLPQRLNPAAAADDAVLYYRVSRPCRRARLRLLARAADETELELALWNKQFLTPGEMQSIPLTDSLKRRMAALGEGALLRLCLEADAGEEVRP